MMMKGVSLLSASVLTGTLLLLVCIFVHEGLGMGDDMTGLKCINVKGEETECKVNCTQYGKNKTNVCERQEKLYEGHLTIVQYCHCKVSEGSCSTNTFYDVTTTTCWCSIDLCNSGSCGERHPNCPTSVITTTTSNWPKHDYDHGHDNKNDGHGLSSGATTATPILFSVPALVVITSSCWTLTLTLHYSGIRRLQ